MKRTQQHQSVTDSGLTKWLLGGLIAITLFFQTTLADPFNSPKAWILLLVAAWLTGHIIADKRILFKELQTKRVFYLSMAFILSIFVSTFFADSWYPAVFGETQRRNGLISYLSLTIFLIASSLSIKSYNVKRLFFTTQFVSTIFVFYAFMQTTGHDFAKWNNPYNSLIGTVGNPNFAAALMAVMGILVFSTAFMDVFHINLRIFSLTLTLLLLIAIYRSNARQGLVSFFLGIGIFLTIWLLINYKIYGILSGLLSFVIFIFSVLGMLQIGPLERFLYKPSVSVRGYYWRAGIDMFLQNPLVGVGMDRYGAFFKQYREAEYSLRYGFDLTSTNAHNTFIQFFATGGIFLGFAYLALNAYILKRAITGLKNLKGNNRLILSGIFSAWMAFHAQSLVSIDNIGISIWGWILGGSIIGIAVQDEQVSFSRLNNFSRNKLQIRPTQTILSGVLAVGAMLLIATLYVGEVNAYKASQPVNLQDPSSRLYYKELQYKSINSFLNDPNYKLYNASNLVRAGYIDEGLKVAQELYNKDPRNLDTLMFLSLVYEGSKKIPLAITYREKIVELDPWNAVNYLELGKDYKLIGNIKKSNDMLEKILSFAPQSPVAQQAKADLIS